MPITDPKAGTFVATPAGRIGRIADVLFVSSSRPSKKPITSVAIQFEENGTVIKYAPEMLRQATKAEARKAGWDVPPKAKILE